MRKILEISNKIRQESHSHKKITPHSTLNLKTLGLWIFFLCVAQLSRLYSTWDLDSYLDN